MEKKDIIVSSHSQVWQIEHKIYSVGNWVLKIPIPTRDLTYFALVLAIIAFAQKAAPVLMQIPFVIRCVLVPFLVSQFLLRMKLDGKPLYRFILSWLLYLATYNSFVERFAVHGNKKTQRMHVAWYCSRGFCADRKEGDYDFKPCYIFSR